MAWYGVAWYGVAWYGMVCFVRFRFFKSALAIFVLVPSWVYSSSLVVALLPSPCPIYYLLFRPPKKTKQTAAWLNLTLTPWCLMYLEFALTSTLLCPTKIWIPAEMESNKNKTTTDNQGSHAQHSTVIHICTAPRIQHRNTVTGCLEIVPI